MAMPRLDATDDTTLISLKLPTRLLVKARREAVRRGDGNFLSSFARCCGNGSPRQDGLAPRSADPPTGDRIAGAVQAGGTDEQDDE